MKLNTIEYTLNYNLHKEDIEVFKRIVTKDKDNFKYAMFTVVTLIELGDDISKLLRLVNFYSTKSIKVLPQSVINKLINYVKETVILTSYKDFIEDDGFISIHKLSKTPRYQNLGITRGFIINTFAKHNITYNSRRLTKTP